MVSRPGHSTGTTERGWPRLRHSTPTLSFISHSTHLGRWRARDRELFRQPILTPDTTSVVFTRHHLACQSGLTVPRSFLYCLFPGSTLIHYRRTPQSIVRSLPPRISPPRAPTLLPSTSLNALHHLGYSGHNLG